MTIEQLQTLNRAVNYLCNEYSRIIDNPNVEYPMSYALKLTFDHYNIIEQPRFYKQVKEYTENDIQALKKAIKESEV